MAQLVVRNLDEGVKDLLRKRAVRHGKSMEEEIREILRVASVEAEKPAEPLNERLARRFAGLGLSADEIDSPELRGQSARPANFKM
jgi:plasmid stability protein